MGFKKQAVEPEISLTTIPESTYHPNPMLTALSSPVILNSVFQNMDMYMLEKCREVCSIWSGIAKHFLLFHPSCSIVLEEEEIPAKFTVLDRLAELEASIVPFGVKYEIGKTATNLPQILDKIKGTVKRLELVMDHAANVELLGSPQGQERFTQIELPYLKSLSFIFFLPDCTDGILNAAEVNKKFTLALLEIIKRAPNLQELHIRQDNLPIIFWDTLLGTEGLVQNVKLMNTLDTLSLFFEDYFNKNHIEVFRKMDLKLKTLNLEVTYASEDESNNHALTDDRKEQFSALSSWLKDLSSRLETCAIRVGESGIAPSENLEFLTEMKLLKALEIHGLEMLDDGIILLMNQLPQLEKLTLVRASRTGKVVEDLFVDNFQVFCFPNLKELTFEAVGSDELNPSRYFPTLFPNLKKLRMSVYSKNTFLSCIHQLQGMVIEELYLRLEPLPVECKTDGITDVPWDWELPSFASWKRLRKLELNYRPCPLRFGVDRIPTVPQDNSMMHTQVYNLPLENILSSSLTSLELTNLGKIDASFLLKLLEGLPLLMYLGMYEGTIVDKSGKLMKQSVIMDQIRSKPSIHSCLSICDLQISPEEDSNSKETEDSDQE